MKMPSKRMLLPMCALAVVAAGSYGVTQVSAASDAASGQTSIVQKLADTFHLDKSKVQAVFDEQHKEGEAKREQAYADRLAKAVTDGKLTADQKAKVLEEHNKLKAELEAAMKSDTSKTDRKAAMDKIRTEAEQWAKDNGIDAKWLMPAGPGMYGHGMGGMRGHHGPHADGDAENAPTASPTASPAS